MMPSAVALSKLTLFLVRLEPPMKFNEDFPMGLEKPNAFNDTVFKLRSNDSEFPESPGSWDLK